MTRLGVVRVPPTILLFMLAGTLASRAVPFQTTVPTALLIDYNTGAVLFQKHADASVAPTSTTIQLSFALASITLHACLLNFGRWRSDRMRPEECMAEALGLQKARRPIDDETSRDRQSPNPPATH
jgi:hypothetical protein